MAVYDFSDKMLSEKPINVFSHGVLQRDFTYIDDTVNGIIAAINYGADFEVCAWMLFFWMCALE
jgi:nucleoside-diphosphate-sugar epimerase